MAAVCAKMHIRNYNYVKFSFHVQLITDGEGRIKSDVVFQKTRAGKFLPVTGETGD
jgi:hypothetical protein